MERRALLGLAGVAGVAALAHMAKAGPLTPPSGPPAPTGKTVQEIYDKIDAASANGRIAVQSLSGDSSAMYIITQPGSYYLSGNIAGQPNKHAILIRSDNVTVDLNGFTIQGSATSPGAGVVTDGAFGDVRVRNGMVRGVGQGAVFLGGDGCVAEDLIITSSIAQGIIAGSRARVRRCSVRGAGTVGIQVEDGSTVVECVVAGCNDGIVTGPQCTVQGCTTENGNRGIYTQHGCVVVECAVRYSLIEGISVNDQSIVQSCTARSCGNYGIMARLGCLVMDCVVFDAKTGISTLSNGYVKGCTVRYAGTGVNVEDRSRVNSCLIEDASHPPVGPFGPFGVVVGAKCRVEGNHILVENAVSVYPLGPCTVVSNSFESLLAPGFALAVSGHVGPIQQVGADLSAASAWSNFQFSS